MTDDDFDLVEMLCTRAGALMEDASFIAITIRAQPDLSVALSALLRDAEIMHNLIEAADLVHRR